MSHNILEIHKVESININIVVNKPPMKRQPLKVIQDEGDQANVQSPIHKKVALNTPTPSLTCNEILSTPNKLVIHLHPTTKCTLTQYEFRSHYDSFEADVLSSTFNFKGILIRHDISSKLRARMVDWMIEVLSIFSCSLESLFGAVMIMDKYFQFTPKKISEDKIHLIGIASMLMASKLYDVRSLEVSDASDKISRNKYSPTEIKAMEREIAEALKWDLWTPTILLLVRSRICNLENSLICAGSEEDPKTRLILESVLSTAEKFALICVYDSCFMQDFSSDRIAQSCILRGLKKVRKVMLQNSIQIGKWQKWLKSKYGYLDSCISEIGRIEKRLIDISLMNYQKFSFSH